MEYIYANEIILQFTLDKVIKLYFCILILVFGLPTLRIIEAFKQKTLIKYN